MRKPKKKTMYRLIFIMSHYVTYTNNNGLCCWFNVLASRNYDNDSILQHFKQLKWKSPESLDFMDDNRFECKKT